MNNVNLLATLGGIQPLSVFMIIACTKHAWLLILTALICYAAIPGITSATVMDGGAVSLKWTLVERYDLDNFMIECSSVNHMASLLVNNQTFSTELRGLLPHANYNCCVSALFDGYRTQSCVASIVTDVRANSGQSISVTCNADTVGGVLGFIIVIFLLLFILAIVALVYPCLIRPRIQNHKTLSRY